MAEQIVKTQGTSLSDRCSHRERLLFILVARYAKQTSQELHEKYRSPVDGAEE
jgi:hypothetical protein